MTARRTFAVWMLVLLASLLALVSAFTVWTKLQLLDTDTWTSSAVQALEQPDVRDALSRRLVGLLFERVDVEDDLRSRLPKPVRGAAPAAAAAIHATAVRAADAFLATSEARRLWAEINRRAHPAIVHVLEGKPAGPVSTANGAVVLDVRPLLAGIGNRLGVGDRLGTVAAPDEIVLLRSDQLKSAQTAVRALRAVSLLATVLVPCLYGAAIALARGRRRQFVEVCGASLVVVGLVVLLLRRLVGDAIVDSLVRVAADRTAVSEIWRVETTLLRDIGLGLVVYGACFVAAGWLAGPSAPARWIRRTLEPTFERHPVVVYATAFAVWLAVVAWGPTGGTRQLVGLAILAVLIAVGLEAWRRQAIREFGGGDSGPSPEQGEAR
jgi:hypothetical protein